MMRFLYVWESLRALKLPFLSLLMLSVSACVKNTQNYSEQFSHLPNPQVDFLHAMPQAVKGNSTIILQFESKSTSVLGVQYQLLEYSLDNGKNFKALAKLSPNETTYTWLVPPENITQAVIRLTAFDKLGYSSSQSSPVFSIYTTAPVFTEKMQAASVANTLTTLPFGGDCENPFPIQVQVRTGAGTIVSNTQLTCSNGQWSYTSTSNTDGVLNFHFSQSDFVGNITAIDRSWTRDTVVPVLTQTLLVSPAINSLNQVTFGGACETGLNVSVALLPTITPVTQILCASGAWSYTASASSDGVRSYQFSESDAVGNAAPNIQVTWTRDTSAPVLTQTLVSSPVSNSLNQVTFGGVCETGLNVSVGLLPSTTPISQVLCASGAWSYTATGSSDGTRNYQFSEVDAAGNAATPINVTWNRDSLAPVLTQTLVLSPVSNNLSSVTFGGACENGLTVNVALSPSASPIAQVVCSSSSWSYTASATTDGTRTYVFSESDAIGNAAPNVSATWIRNTVVPVLTQTLITSPVNNNLNQVVFGGACQTGLTVQVALLPSTSSIAQVSCPSGTWSYTATATTDGTRNYRFSESDSLGNAAVPINVSWIRNTGAPVLTQNLVSNPTSNNLDQVTFGGSCQTGLTVQVALLPSTTSIGQASCPSGTWSYTATATTDASRTYQFSVADSFGNTASLTSVWNRDTGVPILTQTLVTSPVTNNLNQVIFGGSCETGLTVNVAFLPSTASIAQITCSAGTWSYTVAATTDGTRNYQFSESDAAGNAAPNISVSWTRDTSTPILTQVLLTSPVVNNSSSVTFGGACETGLNVQVALLPSTSSIAQIACVSGSWTYTALASSDASRSYQFSESDSAGNAAPSIIVVWTRDTVPPVLTQTLLSSPVTNNLNQVTFGGACQTGLNIQVALLPSTTSIAQVACTASAWSYTATASTDASRTYQFSSTDSAGNAAPNVSATWIRDTTAPVLTQNLVVSPVTNNSGQVTFGGSCETGLTVKVALLPSTTPIAQVTCALNAWTYTASATTDGVRSYQFSESDAVGNAAANITATWIRDTVAPVFTQTIAPNTSISNASSLSVGGSCDSSVSIVVNLTGPAGSSSPSVACNAGSWNYSIVASGGSAGEGTFQFQASQTDSAGNATQIAVNWIRDFTPPTISSLVLANGASSVISNYIPVSLNAADTATNISHFCLSYTSSSTPTLTDPCWIAVNNPDQPNLIPALTLSLQNFSYRVGYSPGSYTINAWVHDVAGNISSPTSNSIVYAPGTPPVVVNAIAANADAPTLPLNISATTVDQNNPVYIFWKISSAANGLGSQPVQLLVTTDDVNYTSIATLANTGNGGCTADGTRASGCYVWNSNYASNTYFSVRILVTDNNGMITAVTTNPMNGNGLISIAGNTDSGFGASATAAMFVNKKFSYYDPDPGSFVINKNGFVFFRDINLGLVYMSPTDGVIKMLLPLRPSSANTFEGPLADSRASAQDISKIALDYQNGLLLYDKDRIRRIDLNDWSISTFIGGGSSTSDNVGPKQVQFQAIPTDEKPLSMALIPLPNGDVLFQSDQYASMPGRLRFFHQSTQTVDSINVSGVGHGPVTANSNIDSDGVVDIRTEDLVNCSKTPSNGVTTPCNRVNYSVEFDPISANLTTIHVVLEHAVNGDWWYPTANLTPSGANIGASVAPHPGPPADIDMGKWRTVGRDGKIYVVDRAKGRIFRFNKTANAWIKIAGTTTPGVCVDGTFALSCAIQPSDVFADAQSNVFFIDRGTIRTIDGQGNIVTVFGQSFYFGDTGLAISARFNTVQSLDLINPSASYPNGRVALMDFSEFRIREFGIGDTIRTIAGNGTSAYPDLVTVANAQPFNVSAYGVDSVVFSTNPTTGDIYSSRNNAVARLNRSNGLWENLGFPTANGIYLPAILGFDGTNALSHDGTWDAVIDHKNNYFDLVNVNTKTVTRFAGASGASGWDFANCADGTAKTSCSIPRNYGATLAASTYDATASRWLVLRQGRAAIRTFPVSGNIGTLVNLPRAATSFTYVRSGGQQIVYYCGTDGRVYKNIIGGADTALPWRIGSMSCTGFSMKYSSSLNSLVFPYKQKGIYGIAQYWLP